MQTSRWIKWLEELMKILKVDFEKMLSAKTIKRIRDEHFDKLAHLRSIIKQVEEAQKTDKEIKLDSLLSPLKTKTVKKIGTKAVSE
jgi:predicted tellurium resistance membrane protein TerC